MEPGSRVFGVTENFLRANIFEKTMNDVFYRLLKMTKRINRFHLRLKICFSNILPADNPTETLLMAIMSQATNATTISLEKCII